MRLIDAEKVAESWKSTGQKKKDEAEKLMMSGDAEDCIKGSIKSQIVNFTRWAKKPQWTRICFCLTA